MADVDRSDEEIAVLATERILTGIHSSLDGLVRKLDNAASIQASSLDAEEVRDLLGAARTMSRTVRGMRARTKTQRQQLQAHRRTGE